MRNLKIISKVTVFDTIEGERKPVGAYLLDENNDVSFEIYNESSRWHFEKEMKNGIAPPFEGIVLPSEGSLFLNAVVKRKTINSTYTSAKREDFTSNAD